MTTPSSATLCAQRSHSTSRTPLFTVALLLFGVCSAVHLVNHLVGESEGVVDSVSQIGLMALLALVLLAATRDLTPRPRLVILAVVALFFSWLGDAIPRFLDGDTGFMAMIGGFFFAQVFTLSRFGRTVGARSFAARCLSYRISLRSLPWRRCVGPVRGLCCLRWSRMRL